jgi:hypothetical protein
VCRLFAKWCRSVTAVANPAAVAISSTGASPVQTFSSYQGLVDPPYRRGASQEPFRRPSSIRIIGVAATPWTPTLSTTVNATVAHSHGRSAAKSDPAYAR